MIEVHNLWYFYPNQSEPAVADVSLELRPGEVVGIVGPNGSGKSTLGRLLKGLLLPSRGEVVVDGLDTRRDELEVRRRVGLVFQNPNSQIVNAVVEHEVAFGPENIGLPADEIRRRVDQALAAVGLNGRETDECHALHMADKQRVAIAAVLALHPSYLVLDEVTTWIEPAARWRMLDEVLRWSSEQGVGVALITHRMEEAQLCSRLYGMRGGRVEVVGSPVEVLENPAVRARLSLDVPEAFALAQELHRAGLPVQAGSGPERLADELCRS